VWRCQLHNSHANGTEAFDLIFSLCFLSGNTSQQAQTVHHYCEDVSRQCVPTAERTPPSAREPSGEIGVVAPLNSNLGGAGASPRRKLLSWRLYLHVHIDMTDRRASHIDYLGQRAAYEYAASECL